MNRRLMLNQENPNAADYKTKRPKALALLSGGLDSMLAVKLLLDQGVDVEAVNFTTPFCVSNPCSLDKVVKEQKVRLHRIFLGEKFLDTIVNPAHGYGSQMNPCIDCRILVFKKAKELAQRIGAKFLVTGEVLDERPFSQRKQAMLLIEREADLEGNVLRPLSAKLLPESEPEKKGWVDRSRLLAIRGRRRLPQMELARELGIENYPNPSGGCLLTDPRFAERLREHLKHERNLTVDDVVLLKVGRHLRVDTVKVIVGRNEDENRKLLAIAENHRIPYLEVIDYEGPITLYNGKKTQHIIEKAAAITVRYSDAVKGVPVKVAYRNQKERIIEAEAMTDEELENLRI